MTEREWSNGLQILDLVHESIFARDLDLKITFWNAAAEELYGWTREEAIGRNADEFLRCVSPVGLAEREAQLFETGHWQGEFERTTKSGKRVHVEATWAVRRNAAGEPVEVIETARDLTQRRKQEEAIRLTEYRFRNLFQAMAVAFWEIDFKGVGALLIPLRAEGVTDLRAHLLARPDLVRQAMRLARVLDVNQKTLSMFGADVPEQMIGQDVERYWPDESLPVFVEALASTMEQAPHLITETKLLDLQGNKLDILFTVSWSPESRREGVILLGIVDIGDRKRAFEALEESELRYRSIFNRMPIAFWQVDTRALRAGFDQLKAAGVTSLADYSASNPDFVQRSLDSLQVIDVNDELVKLLGAHDRAELLGPMSGFWTDHRGFLDSAEARFNGAETYNGVSRLITRDQREIHILWTAVFADVAETGTILIGAIDITERVLAINSLAQSELKYRNLFQYMPVALTQLDVSKLVQVFAQLRRDGVSDLNAYMEAHPDFVGQMLQIMRVEQVNEHTVKMFGGRNPDDFVGPISRFWTGSEDTIKRSLAARYGGAEAYAEETRLRTLDERNIDVFYTSAFPQALSQMGIGLVGMIDIGDRLQAERMLQQVQADFAHAARVATLGELTASIAHEVNQPLAAIATNGEASLRWLARETPDLEEVRLLAGRMVADARRAADIIAQIRAMASRQAPVHELLALDGLVEEVLYFLRREFQSEQVQVSFTPAGGPMAVRADRTQIQQVLVNLAVNAVQAMAQHRTSDRRLLISLDAAEERVRVEIEDSGPGLPAELVPRLFDSFFTTKPDGLGIGLSICRSIIEAHGGTITAGNGAHGALFRFTLPRADVTVGTSAPPPLIPKAELPNPM
jgi:PAS domain S-box-containing protein